MTRATRLSLKHGDTLLEATAVGIESASEQTEKADKPTTASSLNAPLDEPPNKNNDAARQAMKDFGKGIATVNTNDALIRDNLAQFNFALNSPETTDILIRNLAVAQVLNRAEKLYRLIFGSQISVLKFLNSVGPKPDVEIQPFYVRAKQKFPKFYVGYSYEQWRDFLISQQAILHDPQKEVYAISEFGKDFLKWLINDGLSEEKGG